MPRPAQPGIGSHSGLASIAARTELGAAAVQAGRRPPAGPQGLDSGRAQRTMSGWKQGPVPAIGRRPPGGARHDRRPSHPPGTAPPVTQGIPAAAPGKTAHGTGRGASNDGQTILWSITTDRKRILTWSFVWSYGDSNPRPLACHADPVSRSASDGVERGATHLRELSDWVGVSPRVPEYAGSPFWLPCPQDTRGYP